MPPPGGPHFWIGVVSHEHVLHGVEQGFAMLNHGKEAPLKRLSPGDGFAYYSPKIAYPKGEPLKAFTAIGTVAEGEPYSAAMAPGKEGFRRDMHWDASAREVPVFDLSDRLAFTQGNWGMLARQGLFEVSAKDFAVILGTMTGKAPA